MSYVSCLRTYGVSYLNSIFFFVSTYYPTTAQRRPSTLSPSCLRPWSQSFINRCNWSPHLPLGLPRCLLFFSSFLGIHSDVNFADIRHTWPAQSHFSLATFSLDVLCWWLNRHPIEVSWIPLIQSSICWLSCGNTRCNLYESSNSIPCPQVKWNKENNSQYSFLLSVTLFLIFLQGFIVLKCAVSYL